MATFVLNSNLNNLLANFCCCEDILKQKQTNTSYPQHIIPFPLCHLSNLVYVQLDCFSYAVQRGAN